MPSRVTCLVCYRNLINAEYGKREAIATSRRCLWDWEHGPVVPEAQAKAVMAASVFEGQSVLGAMARVHFAKKHKRERDELQRQGDRDLEDAVEEAFDLISADLEEDGEPRPAS